MVDGDDDDDCYDGDSKWTYTNTQVCGGPAGENAEKRRRTTVDNVHIIYNSINAIRYGSDRAELRAKQSTNTRTHIIKICLGHNILNIENTSETDR